MEEFSRRTGVRCDFRETGLSDTLPDPVRTCVYRVLQESLHNCEKHAVASLVRVEARELADSVVLEIEDDGRGFDVDARGTGAKPARFGILGMRERAASLAGTLEVRSAPGKGTTIHLSVPPILRDRGGGSRTGSSGDGRTAALRQPRKL